MYLALWCNFLTMDILSCHSRKTIGVTNNINVNSVPIRHGPQANVKNVDLNMVYKNGLWGWRCMQNVCWTLRAES